MPRETSADFGSCQILDVSGVCTNPGAMALNRIFLAAYDAAADCISPTTPALAAAIASWFAMPIRAAADDIKITDPPWVRMESYAARTVPKADVRFVASVSCQSASEVR